MTLTLLDSFDGDVERAVVASVLLNPPVALQAIAAAKVEPADFADERCQLVYRAAVRLAQQGEPIDALTIGKFLELHNALDRAGGREFIGGLYDEIPHTDNVLAHARMLRAAGVARRGGGDGTQEAEQSAQVGEALNFLARPASDFLRLPWPKLDAEMGGLMPGTLSFLVGHTGGGKTSFLLTLILRLLAEGRRIYYAGLETQRFVLRTQIACRALGLDHGSVLSGRAQDDPDWPAHRARIMAELERQRDPDSPYARLRFAGQSHIDIASAGAVMARAADFGADLVVIDHIDHVTAENPRGPYIESRSVVQVFDTLSKEYGLRTLAATQTNWTGKADLFRNHRPIQEEHVFMGGHKQHVAHWMLGVYWPLSAQATKEATQAVREGTRPMTDVLAKHTIAVNVMKNRTPPPGKGRHAIVPLGFWRGEVLDERVRLVREWENTAETGEAA